MKAEFYGVLCYLVTSLTASLLKLLHPNQAHNYKLLFYTNVSWFCWNHIAYSKLICELCMCC